jgi:hypothetical protein
MEHLKEDFIKTYSNIPLSLRDDIILVTKESGPITWNVAFFEIRNNGALSDEILKGLKELGLI